LGYLHPVFHLCTENKKGRCIERSEYAEYVEQNKKTIDENKETYKRRQAIVEHPYGIIKRQWGFYYIMTKKGIKRASADVGFIFTAFNLRRIFNIIDKNKLQDYLRSLGFYFSYILTSYKPYTFEISNPHFSYSNRKIDPPNNYRLLNTYYSSQNLYF
jgi:Transposase DDE domain